MTLCRADSNDILWGGFSDDLFVFYDGDGSDWVGNFTAGALSEDVVALYGTGFMDFGSLLFFDITGGVWLDLGDGDQIMFTGLTTTDLHQDDFLFYA